jgi:hypothetical protein
MKSDSILAGSFLDAQLLESPALATPDPIEGAWGTSHKPL